MHCRCRPFQPATQQAMVMPPLTHLLNQLVSRWAVELQRDLLTRLDSDELYIQHPDVATAGQHHLARICSCSNGMQRHS